MAAHHNPRQNPSSSSFRRISSPGVARSMPPSLPLFSESSSDQTASGGGGAGSNSSNLSSSGSGGGGPSSTAASGSSSSGRRRHRHQSASVAASGRGGKLAQDYDSVRSARALCRKARLENDAMVYLDGPQVYTCGNCRTHLTSHDDIISKSFHGRHGRAYLFDQCVNITTGPAEDRVLITGLHSVSDIFCKRCTTLVGWTYAKAYEPSQRYKEGKFIIEKINLHLEESDAPYDVDRPAGERGDRWRVRSMSWGSERSVSVGSYGEAMAGTTGRGSPSGVMGSPGGGSYHGRGGGGGGLGGSSGRLYSSYSQPQTPTRRGLGTAMMSPMSPRSPSDIIYEYRHDDDS